MMIKITEKCSMNCTHCLNSATPNGKHMSMETLKDSMTFLVKEKLIDGVLVVTGGEPTEHPQFVEMVEYICDVIRKFNISTIVTIATNGVWILNHQEQAKEITKLLPNDRVVWQVSTDRRFYPERIDTTKRIFRENGFVLCDDCVEQIYPLGRALDNHLEWKAKGSQCFNVRAIPKQIQDCTLKDIVSEMTKRFKFCSPHIKWNGDIGLGESDFCPKCATIYEDGETIVNKIVKFKCDKCSIINDRLPDLYKQFL